jgi:hypothetical protein
MGKSLILTESGKKFSEDKKAVAGVLKAKTPALATIIKSTVDHHIKKWKDLEAKG